jgi:hypothetical protein
MTWGVRNLRGGGDTLQFARATCALPALHFLQGLLFLRLAGGGVDPDPSLMT